MEAPTLSVAAADSQAWSVLTPRDGTDRPGWPRPMLARGRQICFGFENAVFEAPSRPSLARCVDQSMLPELEADEIASLATIEAGADVWHIVVAAAPIRQLELTTRNGADVADDRIHVDGDIAVLRLSRDDPVTDVRWRAGRAEVRCTPEADAVTTGSFCPSQMRDSSG